MMNAPRRITAGFINCRWKLGLALVVLRVAEWQSTAQECMVPAPCERCAPPPPTSSAPPTSRAPARSAPAPVAAVPMTFAAPPLGGQITGEANGFGLRGFELHIPECRLALPTLHFPTLVRTRRNPEMFVEGGRAPMSSGAVAGFAQVPLAATAAPASPPSAPASPDQPPPTSKAPPSPRCAPAYDSRQSAVPLVPGIGNEYGANEAVSDELEQTRKQLAEVREQLNRLTQAAAAMEEATNASARRARQAGPVRIQSDESELLPEQSGDEIPEPPVTSRRRTRPQQAAVVRSQSPVVPAGGYAEPTPRATAKDAASRRGPALQAAAPAARPAKRFGHAPYNPGSFGR